MSPPIPPTRGIKWSTRGTLTKYLVGATDMQSRPINIITLYTDQSLTDKLKLTYLVGQNDLSGRPNMPLLCRRKILDLFNFLVKNPTDLLFGRRLWMAMGAFLVCRSQTRYNRPVEMCFLCLKYIMLVGSTAICSNFVV